MQQHPTVGDTLTIIRRIAAPPGAVIDARAPLDSSVATLALPPVLSRERDSVRIAYTLAVWSAGHNDLVLPGPIVVSLTGQVDTLPDTHVALDVVSVLPSGQRATTIVPKHARPWIPQAAVSVLPFAVLLPIALIVAAVLQWWWRRPGLPAPVAVSIPVPLLTEARVEAWIAAGEARLALDHLTSMARDRVDLVDWQARADAVRFTAGGEAELARLAREGFRRVTETPAVIADAVQP
jgi:hypothetical protein